MDQFNLYARYYDLLYHDKDYQGEAAYVSGLIRKYYPGAKSILNLGCGTGRHDVALAELGYEVTGVDLSHEMICQAKERLSRLPAGSRVHFVQGDIRELALAEKFDVVISLFHVMSYQTANEDIRKTLQTSEKHLKPGGIFLFDCWYGPGVLSDPPVLRVRRLEDEGVLITRIAEPELRENENRVDVHYEIMVRDKATGHTDLIRELHPMRYLFIPEMVLFIRDVPLVMVHYEEWMTGRHADRNTWNLVFVMQQKSPHP